MTALADLTLAAGGREISGWTRVAVGRSIERVPSWFDISFTETSPEAAEIVLVNPGDECQILLGSTTVLNGYVDRLISKITPAGHTVQATGRGKCQDLVDCAAIWAGGQVNNFRPLDLAQKLAKAYGITVRSDVTDTAVVPYFILNEGETTFEIIDRYARYAGLLAYELPDGSLFLTRAGTARMGSGFHQGVNVEQATTEFSMDQRFSEYVAFGQAVDLFSDQNGVGSNQQFKVLDPIVPRRRRHVLVSDGLLGPSGDDGPGMAWQKFLRIRALWEAARRAGRAEAVKVTVDNWRDIDGNLWTPNALAEVFLPSLKVPQAELLIGDVVFRFDEHGTHADLTLYPRDGFLPQPLGLNDPHREVVSPKQGQ